MSDPTPCALCGAASPLQNSHIAPKFVSRWLKETSLTGRLRLGSDPNKRLQDGVKFPLLCSPCEGLFSLWETKFAELVFRPLHESSLHQLEYGTWLLQFAASMSWRTMVMQMRMGRLNREEESVGKAFRTAEGVLRSFLLGQRPHPGPYEQHLLFLGHAGRMVPQNARTAEMLRDAPENFHRYMHRTTDLRLVINSGGCFVYSKLARILVLGFIEVEKPKKWAGTKIHVESGRLDIDSPNWMSEQIFEDLVTRAAGVWEYSNALTPKQRALIAADAQKRLAELSEAGHPLDNQHGVAAQVLDHQWCDVGQIEER